MEDEAGDDGKVLAVPTDKVLADLHPVAEAGRPEPAAPEDHRHFFEHYKDLEPGKWVKVLGWEGPESAKKEVLDGIEAYKKHKRLTRHPRAGA
jgi:inorganic pyrophosphatase